MKINRGILIKVSFIIALLIGIAVMIIFKREPIENIFHPFDYLFLLMGAGALATIVFVISAIIEVANSPKINYIEKLIWTIGLLFTGIVVGLIYVLVRQKRIVPKE